MSVRIDSETEVSLNQLESKIIISEEGTSSSEPVSRVTSASPETSTQVEPHQLLLADIMQRFHQLVAADEWTDATMQIVENGIDAVLWRDEGVSTARGTVPNAVQLWNSVFESNSKALRWQFLGALRRLQSREAITLEQYVVPIMLKSDSPGDRVAAIKSLWARDTYRARKQLSKLKEKEADPIVQSLITQYLGSTQDGARVHSAA